MAVAQVVQHKLSPADRYVVVASDGLWEFVEAQAVPAAAAPALFACVVPVAALVTR